MYRWFLQVSVAFGLVTGIVSESDADTTSARCDIYPSGSAQLEKMIGCTFSQRQGHITIHRQDNIVHQFSPVDAVPGNFVDPTGQRVYRQSGLGDQGLIFRLPNESIYVFWNTSALEQLAEDDNWTAPFTTADYDATMRLACRMDGNDGYEDCPAGIARMPDGQASITVQNPSGVKYTINFMRDGRSGEYYVNATNRSVEADRVGDTWMVTIDGTEFWKIPVAAIEGG
jgi:hypothetical protein